MPNKQAMRGGNDRAEDIKPKARPVPLFGENGWWQHAPLGSVFCSEGAFRWFVREHRVELDQARCLMMFRHRLFAVEPQFTEKVAEIGERGAKESIPDHEARAQAEADDAVLAIFSDRQPLSSSNGTGGVDVAAFAERLTRQVTDLHARVLHGGEAGQT